MSQQIEPRMRPRPPPPPPANPPPPLRGTSRGFDLAGSSNSVAAAEPMAPALPTASAVSGGGGRPKALMPRSPLVYAGEEIGKSTVVCLTYPRLFCIAFMMSHVLSTTTRNVMLFFATRGAGGRDINSDFGLSRDTEGKMGPTDSPAVGRVRPHPENVNGRQFRQMCEEN